jgi:hypothetical protein
MPEKNIVRETGRGADAATPFFALTGVTVVVAVVVALVLLITLLVYVFA